MAAVPSRGRAHGIEGATAPEADATRALYEQYANQIFRYCLHQLGSREEAEDATQSTFLNAFRGIKRGIVPETESAWLFAIAHNVCLSRRRSTWRRGKVESPADFDVVEELAPAPARRADELIGLQDVLEQMPEQQRRAILLREWQGLSYREIAEELALSQSAVETLIFRARRSLAQGLEQPAAPKRRRALAGAFGNLLSSAQSFLLGGGAAVKVAATVAAVGATTVVATAPTPKHDQTPPKRPATTVVAPARAGGTSGAVTTPGAGGVQRPGVPSRSAAVPVRVRAKAAAPLVAPETPAAPPAVEFTAPPEPPAETAPPVVVEPAARPAPPAAKDEAPGQTTRADEPPSGKADAPGRAKTRDEPARPANESNGNPDAPGQAKKNEAVDPPAAVQPEATPAPAAAPQAESNGNGESDKPGKDKPKK